MVLENASVDPPADDPYGDFSPSSEPPFEASSDNYYATSTSEPSRIPVGPGIFVNTSNLPHPVSIPFIGEPYSSALVESVRGNAKVLSRTLQRPARQDEVDAIAFHTAKGMRLASYGSPIGIVLGLAVAARGHKTFRFPFYSPIKEGGRFNPEKFPFLTGGQARIIWHFARYGAYSVLGSLMCGIFFASYGLTVSMQGRVTDPRLREFMDALRKAQKEGKNIKDFLGQGDGAPGARPRDNETFEMARQRAGIQEVWKQKQEQARSSPQRVVDDASPTGGMFSDELESTPAQRPENPKSTVQESPRDGNAWERLRRGASMDQQKGVGSSQTRRTSAESDSLSFLSEGSDTQTTRGEEQKQFDARLQREREGQDFEGNGGGKWKS